MNTDDRQNWQTFLIGFVAIIAASILASGAWDFFDLIVSLLALLFGRAYMKENDVQFRSKTELFLVAMAFGLISTAVVSSALAGFAVVFRWPYLAMIDVETFQQIFPDLVNSQSSGFLFQIQWASQAVIFVLLAIIWWLNLKRLVEKEKRYLWQK